MVVQACANAQLQQTRLQSTSRKLSEASQNIGDERRREAHSAPKSAAVVRRVSASEVNGQIENVEVLSHSSKRAKTMLSMSQSEHASSGSSTSSALSSLGSLSDRNGGAPAKRPDFLSELSGSIPNVQLSARPGSKVGSGAVSSSAKMVCGICREVASSPCANRCGHVGCERCWEQWLRVNESCPFCRVPASKQSVTRLVVVVK